MSTCFAIENPVFKPAMRIIVAITNGFPSQVTTSFAHGYLTGEIVRIVVPPADGMQQINGLVGTLTVNSDTTFLMDIDTTSFDIFAIPEDPLPQVNTCAMVIPIGEVNEMLRAAVQNVLPTGELS